MQFKDIISQVKASEEWQDKYNYYVPKFIEEAKTGKNYWEWDPELFNEFFEKGGGQCVSSLKQGYFTNIEKEEIKQEWHQLAPLLQLVAENQETPQYDVYFQIKDFLRHFTGGINRMAATNRLIASLQPKLLCTIVNENSLYQLYNYLRQHVGEGVPEYSGNWFESSYRLWQYYREQMPDKDPAELVTLPWETFEFFRAGNHLPKKQTNDMSENPLLQEAEETLRYKHQLILQGAPGTGKTYLAKDIAEKIIFNTLTPKEQQKQRLAETDQFALIQFHPSYTYEDFVRGIEIDTNNGTPEYKTKDKILAQFAKKAQQNWDLYTLSKENKTEEILKKDKIQQFIDHVQKEIENNGKYPLSENVYLFDYDNDRFKYKGDNWEAHSTGLNMKYSELRLIFDAGVTERADIKKLPAIASLTNSHATYYSKIAQKYAAFQPQQEQQAPVQRKDYVLIIDEINRANLPVVLGELIYSLEYRGEEMGGMYADGDDNRLILPPNLYIIGTMNTADRSVGMIDYAIRRRFAFIDMLPEVLDVDGFDKDLFALVAGLFIKDPEKYVQQAGENFTIEPSAALSSEFRPEDVWIGHSYFLMKDKKGIDRTRMRLKYEIIPILKEYLKDGIFKDKTEVGKILDTLLKKVGE